MVLLTKFNLVGNMDNLDKDNLSEYKHILLNHMSASHEANNYAEKNNCIIKELNSTENYHTGIDRGLSAIIHNSIMDGLSDVTVLGSDLESAKKTLLQDIVKNLNSKVKVVNKDSNHTRASIEGLAEYIIENTFTKAIEAERLLIEELLNIKQINAPQPAEILKGVNKERRIPEEGVKAIIYGGKAPDSALNSVIYHAESSALKNQKIE